MTRPRFRLLTTIGRSYAVDTDDVLRTKTVLSRLGYLDTPAMSITRYPDEPMFRGIEEFQDDFDLLPDGVIKPSGETAGKLNEVLEFRHREILTGRQQDAGAVRAAGRRCRRTAVPEVLLVSASLALIERNSPPHLLPFLSLSTR